MIYRFAFLSPNNKLCFRSRLYTSRSRDDTSYGGLFVYGLSAVFVSHQLHAEILELLFSPETRFLFSCSTTLTVDFLYQLQPRLLSKIKHIEIGPQTLYGWSMVKMIPLFKTFEKCHNTVNLTLPFYTTRNFKGTDSRWPQQPALSNIAFRALQREMVAGTFLSIRWVRMEHSAPYTGCCEIEDMFQLWRPHEADHSYIGFQADGHSLALLHPSPPSIRQITEAAERRVRLQSSPGDERFELEVYAYWEDSDTLVMRKRRAEDDDFVTIRAMQKYEARRFLLYYTTRSLGDCTYMEYEPRSGFQATNIKISRYDFKETTDDLTSQHF